MASLQLSIADPCHENWNNMLPEEKGRFCLSCQKTVVDFTSMSDRQIFNYFNNYRGNTCGQFTPDQLDREITKPKTHAIGRWKYFWQILLPAVFAFYKSGAQPTLRGKVAPKMVCKADTAKPVVVRMGMIAAQPIEKPTYKIEGTIVTGKKDPVPFASIANSNGHFLVADSLGRFTMVVPANTSFTISSIGFIQRDFTINAIQPNDIVELETANNQISMKMNIELKQAELNSVDVMVNGYLDKVLTGRLGGISVSKRISVFSKLKPIQPVTIPAQLKIFPNPIQSGQSFQLSIQVKKTGSYIMKITDAAGSIMAEKRLNVISLNYTEMIDGNALKQPGVYFLSISNPSDKRDNGLSGRIVVQ